MIKTDNIELSVLNKSSFLATRVRTLSIVVTSTGRLVAVDSGVGVKYSDDLGKTWTLSTGISTTYNTSCKQLFVIDNVLYLSAFAPNCNGWKSTDNGATWQTFSGGVESLAYVAKSNNVLLVVGNTYFSGRQDEETWQKIRYSEDNGSTFSVATGLPQLASPLGNIHKISDGRLCIQLYGSDGGIYCSANDGKAWTKVSTITNTATFFDDFCIYIDGNLDVYKLDYDTWTSTLLINLSTFGLSSTTDVNLLNVADILYLAGPSGVFKMSLPQTGGIDTNTITTVSNAKVYGLIYVEAYNMIITFGKTATSPNTSGDKISYSLDFGATFITHKNLSNGESFSVFDTHGDKIILRGATSVYSMNITPKTLRAKYLDQNGAAELVAQFRNYVDGLVGA